MRSFLASNPSWVGLERRALAVATLSARANVRPFFDVVLMKPAA
jgi:hypothetical protein